MGRARKPSPDKLKSLGKGPRPKKGTELRAFLGFTNWYQEYVQDYAKYAGPLQNMLRLKKGEAKAGSKKPITWSDEANHCPNRLKEKMLARLDLNLINPDMPFFRAQMPLGMQWGV